MRRHGISDVTCEKADDLGPARQLIIHAVGEGENTIETVYYNRRALVGEMIS